MSSLVIFIDGGYLEKILINDFSGINVDFTRLSEEIQNLISPDIEILRTYYYHSLPYKSNPPTPEESERFSKRQRFINALNRKPKFEVRLGRLAKYGPDCNGNYKFEQKMVDALFSIDLVQLSAKGRITHAAILAGDGDFVPSIKSAKDTGVSIWLIHGSSRHSELWQVADERYEINSDFLKNIEFTNSH